MLGTVNNISMSADFRSSGGAGARSSAQNPRHKQEETAALHKIDPKQTRRPDYTVIPEVSGDNLNELARFIASKTQVHNGITSTIRMTPEQKQNERAFADLILATDDLSFGDLVALLDKVIESAKANQLHFEEGLSDLLDKACKREDIDSELLVPVLKKLIEDPIRSRVVSPEQLSLIDEGVFKEALLNKADYSKFSYTFLEHVLDRYGHDSDEAKDVVAKLIDNFNIDGLAVRHRAKKYPPYTLFAKLSAETVLKGIEQVFKRANELYEEGAEDDYYGKAGGGVNARISYKLGDLKLVLLEMLKTFTEGEAFYDSSERNVVSHLITQEPSNERLMKSLYSYSDYFKPQIYSESDVLLEQSDQNQWIMRFYKRIFDLDFGLPGQSTGL